MEPIPSRDDSPNEKGWMNREDGEWQTLSQQWLKLHSQIQALEVEKNQLRERLIQLAAAPKTKGCGIKLIRFFRKGNIDYSKIPELKSIDLEKYRKEAVAIWNLMPCD